MTVISCFEYTQETFIKKHSVCASLFFFFLFFLFESLLVGNK